MRKKGALVGETVGIGEDAAPGVAFLVLLGESHVSLGVARVVQFPFDDGGARHSNLHRRQKEGEQAGGRRRKGV